VSVFSHPRSRAGSLVYHPRERAPSRYRTLSAAAANVASAAAVLATQRNEPSTSPRLSPRWSRRSLDGLLDTDRHRSSRHDDDDVDEDAFAMLGDSFHSEWSGRHKHFFQTKESQTLASNSRSRSRQAMPSSSIPAALQITSTTDDVDPSTRGRTLQRANRPSLDSRGEHTWLSSEEGSQRRSSRASRRGASMVFMGVCALFGLGTLGVREYSAESGVAILPGKVLSSSSLALSSSSFPSPTHESPPLATLDVVFDTPHFEDMNDRPPAAGPPMERVIGRISAWMCTTLYLTSRLPQIWKNVRV
jgi:solute carrier family 66 (lysosomal lysine-arginine transporter), member 1